MTSGRRSADKRSFKTMYADKKITCQALAQLNSDRKLRACAHLSVATFNRVVLLVGEAQTPELRRRAFDLIKDIPEIRRITNEVTIEDPLLIEERSNDTWVTTKVKTALLAERDLHSTQIKVITENSTVFLMGLVSHEQASIAVAVTRQVKGVYKVVTLFEYGN